MGRIQRIVCAVDFSDSSRRGLDYAIALARWAHATVTVLHVLPPTDIATHNGTVIHPATLPNRVDDLDAADLDLSMFPKHGDVPIEPVVVEGEAVAEIVRFVETAEADLLVVGAHGGSALRRLGLGSVTERLLRLARCPVLTVPRSMGDHNREAPLLQNIVCAIDFSPCSLDALDYAASIANLAKATLTVLHVFEPDPESDNDRLRAAAERRLSRAATGVLTGPAQVKPVFAVGEPATKILEFIQAERADLIVLGVTARSPAQLFFLGSTANHVVRRAPCAVLTLGSRRLTEELPATTPAGVQRPLCHRSTGSQ